MTRLIAMPYEAQTRAHYQNREIARKYKSEYDGPIRLGNLRAKIIAHRERTIVKDLLGSVNIPLPQIIDFPCGTGKMGEILGTFAERLVAADISPEMIEFAENEYMNIDAFTGFVVADASATPFREKQFDCVVMMRLLHRLPMALKSVFLKEIHRITSQYAVVSYSTNSAINNLRQRTSSPRKINYIITQAQFADMCNEIGFRIIANKPVLPFLSTEVIALLRVSSLDTIS